MLMSLRPTFSNRAARVADDERIDQPPLACQGMALVKRDVREAQCNDVVECEHAYPLAIRPSDRRSRRTCLSSQ